jgi:lysylphosphatidylglycerol synthetase-like protein (DUF2156 family)
MNSLPIYLKSISVSSCHLPHSLFPSGFPITNLYAFIISSMHATFPTYLPLYRNGENVWKLELLLLLFCILSFVCFPLSHQFSSALNKPSLRRHLLADILSNVRILIGVCVLANVFYRFGRSSGEAVADLTVGVTLLDVSRSQQSRATLQHQYKSQAALVELNVLRNFSFQLALAFSFVIVSMRYFDQCIL